MTLEHVSDLEGALACVEAVLRELRADGRAGKTVSNYAEALAAFCDWCVERAYFVSDPLKNLRGFDTTPQTQRRAITTDEVRRLLAVCPTYRRLLWETALLSGLRANELRHLSIDHLDVERGGLYLDASWTKNRRDDFLPLPRSLVHRLHIFATTGEVTQKYQQVYASKEVPRRVPTHPLLYVPRDPARELDKGLKAAAIPKYTREGKVDFHALRLAYTSSKAVQA